MQDSLTSMECVIKMVPLRNRESFEQTLARWRAVITELRARFAAFDEELQRLIRDEEAQAEEGGRNAPDDGWLNRIGITLAVLLVIAAIAAIVLPPFCPS
jgi:anti-sigma factor RsiW